MLTYVNVCVKIFLFSNMQRDVYVFGVLEYPKRPLRDHCIFVYFMLIVTASGGVGVCALNFWMAPEVLMI